MIVKVMTVDRPGVVSEVGQGLACVSQSVRGGAEASWRRQRWWRRPPAEKEPETMTVPGKNRNNNKIK